MKNFILFLLSVLPLSQIFAQKKARVVGTVPGKTHIETVYLRFMSEGELKLDSAVVKNGKFAFSPEVKEPVLAMLRVRYPATVAHSKPAFEVKQFYLEPGETKITIHDSLATATIKGGQAQRDFDYLNGLMKPFNEKSKELTQQYMKYRNEKDKAGMDRIEAEFDQMDSAMKEDVYLKFLDTKKNSPLSLYALENFAGYDIDAAAVAPIFEKLSEKDRNSTQGKEFAERLEKARKTAVGVIAMNFTQNDTLGKPVSLSDFRGKYVLIDFWASWCGPCRAENPNVVKAFNQYKDKNFTVLGVSLDQEGQKKAWMDAIHKDHLTWTQVSDLKFWDNAVAKQYGIRAIPQNFLIDPKPDEPEPNRESITFPSWNYLLKDMVKT